MSGLPLAFSVHKFVTSVGADVGFAALIGLAVLVLLFFAQARETAGLRARAEELLARVAELEARLARVPAESRAAPAAPAPGRVTTAAPASVVGPGWATQPLSQATVAMPALAAAELAALELAPFPPAGVGAPALSAATRVVPAGVPIRATANRPAPAPAPAPPPAPAPMTAAATATNGSSRVAAVRVAERPPARSAPAPASTRTPAPRPGDRRPPARPPLTGGDRVVVSRTPWGRIGVVALTVLVVAAGAAAAAIAISHGSSSHKPPAPRTAALTARTSGSTRTNGSAAPKAAAVNPASVTVAVLNGTGATGAAGRVSARLVTQGFRPGRVTDAANMTQSATLVAYTTGHRNDALAVAQSLKLPASAVQPIDQSTLLVACGGASSCGTSVVVTVGANLATQ